MTQNTDRLIDQQTKMKKVLIIASEFPPRGVGNILRTVKLVKHLPSFGWQPYVLTLSLRSIEKFDYSYEDEIPEETHIVRALCPNPFILLDRRWHRKRATQETFLNTKRNIGNRTRRSLKSLAKRVILCFIGFFRKHLFVPSELILWVPLAAIKGIWICNKERVNLIYSTVPHYENHLVGLLIRMLTRRKWMADYRDLWTDYPTRRISSRFRKKIEEIMEMLVLRNADTVNIVSPRWREFLLQRFSFLSPRKVTCYTNGFDSEDYLINTQTENSDPIRWKIAYVGSILHMYPTPLFLKALGELCGEVPELRDEVEVSFYGNIHDEQLAQIMDITEGFSLQRNVSIGSIIPRQNALRIIEDSDLLLLMYIEGWKNTDGCIPAKLFEYIGVRKPVFAIVPKDGSAAEIIRKGNIGIVASPSSYAEIKKGLKRLYLSHKQADNPLDPDWHYLGQFDRRYIVSKLAEIFGCLCL